MDLKHIVANQRRRTFGPSLDINFTVDRSNISRIGPSIPFSRASSGTFVNKNGVIVGKTRSTTTINPVDYPVQRALTIDVPSGSVVGWVIGSIVMIMQDTDGNDVHTDGGMWIEGNMLSYTDTTLTIKVRNKSGIASASSWQVSYRGLRIGHDPISGRCLGALLETTKTNQLRFSSDFTGGFWDAGGQKTLIPVPNSIISPSGETDAQKLIVGTGAPPPTPQGTIISYWSVLQGTQNLTNGRVYTISGYLKAGEVVRVNVWVGSTNRLPINVVFDLNETGSVVYNENSTACRASIQYFKGGWYKFAATATYTHTDNNSTTTIRVSPIKPNVTGRSWGEGNGVDGFYAWGFQFEEGTYASSYIPTTDSITTRAIDVYEQTSAINSFYNQNQSTAVIEYEPVKTDFGSPYAVWGSNRGKSSFGTSTLASTLLRNHRGGVVYDTRPAPNFASVANFEFSIPVTVKVAKSAFAVQKNNFAMSVNGLTALTDNEGEFPLEPMTRIRLGGNENSGQQLDGYISKFRYYPKRLTNEKLQELSAIVTDSLTLGEDPIIYSTDPVTITI